MKRSDIKMDLATALKEVKREIGVRGKLYPNWIRDGKLSENIAAKRYIALVEIQEVLELAEKKDLDLNDLKDLLSEIQPRTRSVQQRINFGKTKNPY